VAGQQAFSCLLHTLLLSACRHVVLPIINSAHSADTTAATASRQWALQVALTASKPGGLCDHLSKQLCTLCAQWRSARAANTGRDAVQQVRRGMQRHQHGLVQRVVSTELLEFMLRSMVVSNFT
jgi:hypothetical protein